MAKMIGTIVKKCIGKPLITGVLIVAPPDRPDVICPKRDWGVWVGK